ncbi:MAG: glutamine amidotransferase-related protein, partial [Pseudonocardiaceae bacterium]
TCLETPAFSVQYHPEAAAGPHDAAYLFDRFCQLMSQNRGSRKPNSEPNGARGGTG